VPSNVQGNLVTDPFPNVIHTLGKDKANGVLQLSRNDIEKRVYFGRGSMVFAGSSLHSDRLGEFLVKQGKLSKAQLALASNKMRAQNSKLGATLVSLGLMNERTMESRVTDQVKGIIYSLFSWSDGQFHFDETPGPLSDVQRVDLPTVPILLEGTRHMDEGAIREAMGDLARVVNATKDPQVVAHYANLTPEEGFVLSRVDGAASLTEIVLISPLDETATLRCLYGLMTGGFLELGRKSRAVAPFQTTERPPIESFHVPKTATIAEKATPPSRVAAPSALQAEIETKLQAVSNGTFFDWLELRRNASVKEVKKAFAAQIMKFHPDRSQSDDPLLRQKLETIIAKLTEAHETLGDDTARKRYDNSLKSEAPKGEALPPEPPKPPAAENIESASRQKLAERYFAEASRFYEERDYHQAIKLMEEATRLVPHGARYHRLLAQGLMKNPKWRKNAEDHFKTALSIDRFDAAALSGLAELYETVGLHRRAKALYAEAAQIDPANGSWTTKARTL